MIDVEQVEEAIWGAIQQVCQSHGVVAMDYLGVVTFADAEGDERVMFVDSGIKAIKAMGMMRLIEEWSNSEAARTVYGCDVEED